MPTDHDHLTATGCEHERRAGCVYCPVCGTPYPRIERRRPLGCLLGPIEWFMHLTAPTSVTPDLDVTLNLEALRSGDRERMRRALGFLLELASPARRIRADVELLTNHEDRDIALRARDVVRAMDAVDASVR